MKWSVRDADAPSREKKEKMPMNEYDVEKQCRQLLYEWGVPRECVRVQYEAKRGRLRRFQNRNRIRHTLRSILLLASSLPPPNIQPILRYHDKITP